MSAEEYIFICYARDDANHVSPVVRMLEQEGIACWIDEAILPGSGWREEVAAAIQGATAVLFFASGHSVQSDHCFREIELAQDELKDILVVDLDDHEKPPKFRLALSGIQTTRLRTEAPLSDLVSELKASLGYAASAREIQAEHRHPFYLREGHLSERWGLTRKISLLTLLLVVFALTHVSHAMFHASWLTVSGVLNGTHSAIEADIKLSTWVLNGLRSDEPPWGEIDNRVDQAVNEWRQSTKQPESQSNDYLWNVWRIRSQGGERDRLGAIQTAVYLGGAQWGVNEYSIRNVSSLSRISDKILTQARTDEPLRRLLITEVEYRVQRLERQASEARYWILFQSFLWLPFLHMLPNPPTNSLLGEIDWHWSGYWAHLLLITFVFVASSSVTRITDRTLESLYPVLELSRDNMARLRRNLIRRSPHLFVILVTGAIVTYVVFLLASELDPRIGDGLLLYLQGRPREWYYADRFVLGAIAFAGFCCFVYQTVRNCLAFFDLGYRWTIVDIRHIKSLDPYFRYGLSVNLTLLAAIGLLLYINLGLQLEIEASLLVVICVLSAVVLFVLAVIPTLGVKRRLVAQKAKMIESIQGHIDRALANTQGKATPRVVRLIAERREVEELPTSPAWRARFWVTVISQSLLPIAAFYAGANYPRLAALW